MTTYAEVTEIHRNKSIGYIARAYGVSPTEVTYLGVIKPSRVPFRAICENHWADRFDASGEPVLFVQRPPVIELKNEFVHRDNMHNRQTNLFAGQCPDCGRVYVVESKYGIA